MGQVLDLEKFESAQIRQHLQDALRTLDIKALRRVQYIIDMEFKRGKHAAEPGREESDCCKS
jgi:hypothetical protein